MTKTIVVAALIVFMYQLVTHYFPWEMWLGVLIKSDAAVELPKPAAYVIGTLGYVVPLVYVLWEWGSLPEIWLVTVLVCAAGLSVIFSRSIDWLRDRIIKATEMEERYAEEEAQGRSSRTRVNS